MGNRAQYIEQFRIVLYIFQASAPTFQRDCPSMAQGQAHSGVLHRNVPRCMPLSVLCNRSLCVLVDVTALHHRRSGSCAPCRDPGGVTPKKYPLQAQQTYASGTLFGAATVQTRGMCVASCAGGPGAGYPVAGC